MTIVRNMFPGHLISRFGDVPWPLSPPIRQEIRPIDRQLLARVMDDFKKKLENCIQEDGRHLTDIIFKT
jgi:hypothetical protein